LFPGGSSTATKNHLRGDYTTFEFTARRLIANPPDPFDGGNQSSDGGLLLLREAERKLGVCRRLAEAMRHAMFEMVMARASAIACGYEDAIDLDRLRHDPLMKVAVGRCP